MIEATSGPFEMLDETGKEAARFEARAAVTAYMAEAGDGWMPIETAPKDGTEIDLWFSDAADAFYGGYRICNCWWSVVDGYWYGPRGAPARHLGNQAGRLTHWRYAPERPLPAPPAAQEKK